ncbi:hypothetical protein OEA41_009488 [Lepraria neglecta]|uniref:Uncharacterized protein n=1 Tax=Lepraria neglecta TaxID=209136 RepID=A0AAD9Z4D4_9LECA|nr:hypothetical protein OEA41_009488 [Lepraria neglecta]
MELLETILFKEYKTRVDLEEQHQEQEAEESKDEKERKREDESKNGKQHGPEFSEVEGSECPDSIEFVHADEVEEVGDPLSLEQATKPQLSIEGAHFGIAEPGHLSHGLEETRGKPTQNADKQPKYKPVFGVQAAKTAAATPAKSVSPPVFDFAETSSHRPFSFTAGPSTKKVEDGPKVAFQQSTKPESNSGLEELAQNADTEGKAHFQFDCQARAVDVPEPETHFAETVQGQMWAHTKASKANIQNIRGCRPVRVILHRLQSTRRERNKEDERRTYLREAIRRVVLSTIHKLQSKSQSERGAHHGGR